MKLDWTIVMAILLLAIVIISRYQPLTEGYDAATMAIAQQALKDVEQSSIKIPPQSITRVGLVSSGPQDKPAGLFQWFTQYATMRARPKYTLKNSVIILGSGFSVEGSGKTSADARAQAQAHAQDAIKNIENVLRSTGKMIS